MSLNRISCSAACFIYVQPAAPHNGREAIASFFEGMELSDVTLDLDDGALDAQSVGNGEELCKAI